MAIPVTQEVPADRRMMRAAAAPPQPLLTVVVPTFNERDNVVELVERVSVALEGVTFEIIFVDDSTDDTPQVILGLEPGDAVKLIHREAWERDGGLSTAVLRGLRAARGVYVAVIDGDLQHPPEKLRDMLAAARRESADVVVASRYLDGGSAHGLAGWSRRLFSFGCRWFSKTLFYDRLRKTSDPGSGYFLVHRDVIEGIELRPIGYKILMEVLVRGRWSRIAEVPYRFQARNAGDSKADFRQGMQYLRHTARIFVEVPDVARLWKFLAVGASGVAVNLGILWTCTEATGGHVLLAWSAAAEGAVISNFCLNRTFTWRDRRAAHLTGAIAECVRYHASSLGGIACNFVTFTVAMSVLDAPALVAGLAGVSAGLASNFAGATRFVFPPGGAPRAAAGTSKRRLTLVAASDGSAPGTERGKAA